MHINLKIHPSRAGQLRAMAARAKSTTAGVIESFLSNAMIAGQIPDRFDGFAIERRTDHVTLAIAGQKLPPLSLETTRHLSRAVAQMIEGSAGSSVCVAVTGRQHIELRRAGAGFRLALINSDSGLPVSSLTLTSGMLSDVSRQLQEAGR